MNQYLSRTAATAAPPAAEPKALLVTQRPAPPAKSYLPLFVSPEAYGKKRDPKIAQMKKDKEEKENQKEVQEKEREQEKEKAKEEKENEKERQEKAKEKEQEQEKEREKE